MTPPEKETALETRVTQGERLFSPSAARNRDAIRNVFLKYLPQEGAVLEIGSGTGEHGAYMASVAPGLRWHAGDPDEKARSSIAAWIEKLGLANLKGPHDLDVTGAWWERLDGGYDAIVSINMIHIAPFTAAKGLFAGAEKLLAPGGKLILYGPFSDGGVFEAPSNEAFDASLKARDPRWGVRDLEHDIAPLAHKHAFMRDAIVAMPANNFTVVFVKL